MGISHSCPAQAGDLLRRTMGKLDAMIGAGGNRHMWYLVAFVMAVMFCLWWLAKR